jgi:hypothetical protein
VNTNTTRAALARVGATGRVDDGNVFGTTTLSVADS